MTKEFKIIRILSDTEFIIDGGSSHGITSGQKFRIINPSANPIKGLDGTMLGNLGAKKATLIAIDVRDLFSVLRTARVTTNSTVYASAINPFKPVIQEPVHYKRVIIDPSEMEPIKNTKEPIHKGDLALPMEQ